MGLYNNYDECGVNVIEDKILVSTDEGQNFDKMQIALAIRNSTYEDNLSCSLLKKGVLKNWDHCCLQFFCEKLEEVAEEYITMTSTVVNTFKFK